MSIQKQYLKTKPVCKVTFTVAADQQVESVALAGDFNEWDPKALLLKKSKNGVFSTSLNLEPNKQYQFRYVINGEQWVNDDEADAYLPTDVSYDQNSVLQL
ncbi:isoamylase early set domain-containing protein [Rheinheimera sp.]|uniref:isoamylase early set domain-containing protein n=1 Tax=Rheinheimera sp. TaxID=1869214 RepID=UPI00307ECB7F